jgi:large subunit ribosomal protein L1
MDKKKLTDAVGKAFEGKGKRKFKQSVELIVNFRGVDFTKSENRLNIDISLPGGKGGKEPKIAVIAEEAIGAQAKTAGADLIIPPADLATWAGKEKQKEILEYSLLSQPNLMGQVAKNLGQFLGPRGKLPRPIIGNVRELIENAKKSVRIASKGKFLPVAQCFVGTEEMKPEQIADNINSVYEAIVAKVSEGNIKSVFVKLSMGKPVRVM